VSQPSERLTRRTLPESDEHIARLDPDVRRRLGEVWTERVQSELGAGSGFAILVTELFELGADPAVLRLATKATYDEVRHAELCRLLAEAYLGRPVIGPKPKRVSMPEHPGASETLRKHLHVVGLCCINETLAAGFVEACMEESEAPLVRTIQREHLEDEVQHARVGWAHLGSAAVDAQTKREIGLFLPRILGANLALWRSRLDTLPEEGVPAHGYPSRSRLLRSIDETVRDVILPGFSHVGVSAPATRSSEAAPL
jgi:hypothetical protein